MYTGTMMPDLLATVIKCEHKGRDYVGVDECLAEAKKQLAERHPDIPKLFGEQTEELLVAFAANVAWNCAREATRRAKK